MRRAAAAGARLVQFPEGTLSGYAKEQISGWEEVDFDEVRAQMEAVSRLAGELGVWVVLGSAHQLTEPNRPHNSLYVISLSAYPSRKSELGEGVSDSIFEVKARSHASINCYWVALSAPQQTADLVPSGLIGPNGGKLAEALAGEDLVIATLDREAKDLQVALTMARPWRTSAMVGEIFRSRQVTDQRSTDRQCL